MSDRLSNLYRAQIAERCKLYVETVEAIKEVAKTNVELSVVEKNRLSAAYKKK